MDFEHDDKTKGLIAQLTAFMDAHIYPNEQDHYDRVTNRANLWKPWPKLDELKEKARAEGLWNLFLPEEYGEFSPGLTNLEYAPLAGSWAAYPGRRKSSIARRRIRATW